ncbi:MAG TPA: TlpA disulfide reductase family protein [Saprospiraceae bacterium]|nr:TlpA disulfide reductase family protein [Saprospiraceae bacterium]HRK81669.1 TlpA disulfide reductase family protein [Saprospiraceae bacterium]
MKHFSLLVALLLSSVAFSQKTVTLTCKVDACQAPLRLFKFDGLLFKDAQISPVTSPDGSITFAVPGGKPQFYYLGFRSDQTLILILGAEKDVRVEGSCNDIRTATISGSPLNDSYQWVKNRVNIFKNQTGQLIQQYQAAMGNQQQTQQVTAQMKALDDQKLQLLDSLQRTQPYLAKIAALNTYLSWPNSQAGYSNEIEYFAKAFFKYADFKDEGYEGLPWVFEAFQGYASTLVNVGLDDATQKVYFEQMLEKIPAGTMRSRMALAGIIGPLKQKNSPNYVVFAERLLKELKAGDEAAIANLQQQVAGMRSFTIGAEAPDFAQATPEGKMLKLSELRGKVVLIDFWASWCGPCRRENPNVVRMYQQYKDKGFEILGVSLDRDRQRWLDAIQQDGLTWLHVSDLQQWSNAVAQMYGVSSIPHTVLLDAEGRILARNLRGEALEHKLAEIFK